MTAFSFTPKQLRQDMSGQYIKELAKAGYRPAPIVNFWGKEYVVTYNKPLKSGRNTLDVISVDDFNKYSEFKVARSGQGYAYIYTGEGLDMLVEYNGTLTDYVHPPKSVLVFNIVKPSKQDMHEVNEAMMDELEANTP